MSRRFRSPRWIASLGLSGIALLPFVVVARAQEIRLDSDRAPAAQRGQRVGLDSDTFTVSAGRPDWIELRFHVIPGFHINSHTPHDETLIPTSLKLSPSTRLRVVKDEYPAGVPLHLNIGEGATLSTYSGEFRVRVQVISDKGDANLAGTLHYQACDAASCYPPRDLPVSLTISAR